MSVFSNFWTVIAVAGIIGAIGVIQGHWTSGLLVALLFLVVIGAIFPPAGVLVGLVAVVVLIFRHGTDLAGKSTTLLQGAKS